MNQCKYGCGNIGITQLKNGSWICSNSYNQCPVNRNKNSKSNTGRTAWNTGKTIETDPRVKKNSKSMTVTLKRLHKENLLTTPSFLGKSHSEETKKKIAKSMKGNNFGRGRGKITFYKNIKMKSTWEAEVAKYLDAQNISWKYEEKIFSLSPTQSYRPDFFIYDSNGNFIKLIEVKGYFRKDNIKKFSLFQKQYPDIIVDLWDHTKLLKLKLIKLDGTIY